MRRRRVKFTTCNSGQALVEFAVLLPILMLILTAIFTFAIALHNYLELTEAVNIGARALAVSRGWNTTDPCAQTAGYIYNSAPFLSQSNISLTFVLNGTTYQGASCNSSSTTTGAAGNLVQGATAQVTATYPCNISIYGYSVTPSCTMTTQTTELVQ